MFGKHIDAQDLLSGFHSNCLLFSLDSMTCNFCTLLICFNKSRYIYRACYLHKYLREFAKLFQMYLIYTKIVCKLTILETKVFEN